MLTDITVVEIMEHNRPDMEAVKQAFIEDYYAVELIGPTNFVSLRDTLSEAQAVALWLTGWVRGADLSFRPTAELWQQIEAHFYQKGEGGSLCRVRGCEITHLPDSLFCLKHRHEADQPGGDGD